MLEIDDDRFACKISIFVERNRKSINTLDLLQTINVHALSFELWKFFRLFARFFKTDGRHEKIDV